MGYLMSSSKHSCTLPSKRSFLRVTLRGLSSCCRAPSVIITKPSNSSFSYCPWIVRKRTIIPRGDGCAGVSQLPNSRFRFNASFSHSFRAWSTLFFKASLPRASSTDPVSPSDARSAATCFYSSSTRSSTNSVPLLGSSASRPSQTTGPSAAMASPRCTVSARCCKILKPPRDNASTSQSRVSFLPAHSLKLRRSVVVSSGAKFKYCYGPAFLVSGLALRSPSKINIAARWTNLRKP